MTVYIDLLFGLNFVFDFVLLVSVNYIVRRNVKIYRLILGSLVGELTLLLLFVEMPSILLFLIKLLLSFLMLIVSFGYKDIKYFFKNVLYFYLVSMLLGGAITFLNNQFSYKNSGLVFTKTSLSISYGIILFIGAVLFYRYMKGLKELKNHYSNYFTCDLFVQSKKIVLNAFLDTGNKLKDPYSNKGIILVDENKIKDVFMDTNPIYVPYHSLNNQGLLSCFKPNKVVINGKVNSNCLIGVSNNHFFLDGIDCIISETILEGLH